MDILLNIKPRRGLIIVEPIVIKIHIILVEDL